MIPEWKRYTPEQAKALVAFHGKYSRDWGYLATALVLSFVQLEQRAGDMNSEYCWMHTGPDMGGWTCQHPECKGR